MTRSDKLDFLKLFSFGFSASKSKFSDLLPEYVLAEKVGAGMMGPGECFPYYKECPRSLFKTEIHKYRLGMLNGNLEL